MPRTQDVMHSDQPTTPGSGTAGQSAPGPLHSGMLIAALLTATLFGGAGCGPGSEAHDRGEVPRGEATNPAARPPDADSLLVRHLTHIDERMAAVDSLFQPLPLLRSAQEAALRQSAYGQQLARARELGVGRSPSADQLDALQGQGRLVPLSDSTHWVVRTLNYSEPLVVPALRAALTRIGERFHARLAAIGASPFRLEVSSALRTAADQRALRRVNANAASGTSTHEYGTSVDLAYSAFAAPATPIADVQPEGAAWAADYLRRYQDVAAGRVAARRALELKAILGEVLIEVQQEGLVMVTMERRQPVFHLTLAQDPLPQNRDE